MKNLFQTLDRVGLPEPATKIYLSLLEYGQGNPSDISRHAQMHRTDVYRFLPLLEDRQLVTRFLSGKRTLYRANDPKRLKNALANLESKLDAAIGTLEEKRKLTGEGMFEYARGIDAIRNTYERTIDELPEDATMFRYSSRKRRHKDAVISPEYVEKRRKKRILRKAITNEIEREGKANDPYRESVAIPKRFDIFDYDITKSVAGDTVTIVDYETLEVFTIRNRQLARFEEKIFDLLFRKLREESGE
jgi:sugar-specific transcriptional regulator TrmB